MERERLSDTLRTMDERPGATDPGMDWIAFVRLVRTSALMTTEALHAMWRRGRGGKRLPHGHMAVFTLGGHVIVFRDPHQYPGGSKRR